MKSALIFAFSLFAISFAGECDKICTDEWDPVCASNGQTFSNMCEFEVALCESGDSTLQLMGKGECSSECDTACPMNIDEVCGSNGITFANQCLMNLASCLAQQFHHSPIVLSSVGSCDDSPCAGMICTDEYDPVCATNGQTYPNLCEMNTASCFVESAGLSTLTLAHTGTCEEADSCAMMCTEEYNPVCGSNGVTYSNMCEFHVAMCESHNNIRPMGHGECSPECVTPCPFNFHEVCGSNGVTFSNECLMQVANCLSNQFEHGDIKMAYDGNCHETTCDDIVCTMEFNPVCASNGMTYPNLCAMAAESCFRNLAKLDDLVAIHQGMCEGDDEYHGNGQWNPIPWADVVKFDVDSDNTLTWSEFLQAIEVYNPHTTEAIDIFHALDQNLDSHICQEEYDNGIERGVNIIGFRDDYQSTSQPYNFFTTTAGIVVLSISGLALAVLIISVTYMCLRKQAVNSNGDFVELDDEDEGKDSAEMEEVKAEKI